MLLVVAALGHLLWLLVEGGLRAVFNIERPPHTAQRPFRYCPACGAEPDPHDRDCPRCALAFDSPRALSLHRVRVAEREIDRLLEDAQIEPGAARATLDSLKARARRLRGLPAKPKTPSHAYPVTAPAPSEPDTAPQVLEPIPEETAAPANETVQPQAAVEPLPPVLAALEVSEPPARPRVPSGPPAPPARRGPGFLEAHNILWGELVGGLLIVGCSIALVVTLRQKLEDVPYIRFLLSAAVTLGLFGAGQYTLHRWKLSGASRGMLVISMLLTPLTLLLLAAPFTEGTSGGLDTGVKLLALAAFVGVVRTGGRDLIGTAHLPGPVDRRWLLALAVVGAAGTQLLPAHLASGWFPLVCFAVASAATLGGLSWYHPGRRDEPVPDKSGTALL
ncbi:MAG TPA: hypothetical protein VGE74_04915, partial [Gemmata sp.]